MSFSLCLSLSKKQYSIFMLPCGSTHKIEFATQIHKFREHGPGHPLCRYAAIHLVYLGIYTREEKMCPSGRGFSSSIRSKAWFRARGCSENDSFSTASGTMSFSLCLLGLCNFCLADNHTDQRIKFIIVRGRLSGGSIPALSITLSIHAILRPSFSMTSTPSISCTASPLSAPCTAFQ